jgi:hypothetical protein
MVNIRNPADLLRRRPDIRSTNLIAIRNRAGKQVVYSLVFRVFLVLKRSS